MITLYQAEWCPWCHRVRQVLSELGLTYTTVNVPVERAKRKQVEGVSGQVAVPVLVDGDKVLTDSARSSTTCAPRTRRPKTSMIRPKWVAFAG